MQILSLIVRAYGETLACGDGVMVKAIGPTVPRWQLGVQLAQLRERAAMSFADVAKEMDCSEWKIRRIEQGQTSISRPELRTLLTLYDAPEEAYVHLEELQQLGRQRGWWARHSRHLRANQATIFGVESAATSIKTWEPLVIPGLLQTEGYSRALAEARSREFESIARYIDIRRMRQKKVWEEDPPAAWIVLDESVLLRNVGGPEVMREQLERLLDPPGSCVVQVVPLRLGEHPAMSGGLSIFEFPDDLHTPIALVEGHAGAIYLEGDELDQCKLAMDHLLSVALPPSDSMEMVRNVLGRM